MYTYIKHTFVSAAGRRQRRNIDSAAVVPQNSIRLGMRYHLCAFTVFPTPTYHFSAAQLGIFDICRRKLLPPVHPITVLVARDWHILCREQPRARLVEVTTQNNSSWGQQTARQFTLASTRIAIRCPN